MNGENVDSSVRFPLCSCPNKYAGESVGFFLGILYVGEDVVFSATVVCAMSFGEV